jgi:hypothetical protein
MATLQEVEMQSFVHDENVALYRKLIGESESNPSRDEVRHAMLLRLLAEEIAKGKKSPVSQALAGDAADRRRPSLWS